MVLYSQFFKNFVLRKKQDLVRPNFHPLGDLVLPKDSLVHFTSGDTNTIGPRNDEPLIGSYPDKVNVYFDAHYYPLIGKYRNAVFNDKEAITLYRKGHYKYVYARQLSTFLNKRNELLVNSVTLGSHHVAYTPSRFVFFEKAYNQLNTLVASINAISEETDRNQFFTLELPNGFPNYTAMVAAAEHYRKSFKKDETVPTITNLAIAPYIGYGAYWLIDLYFFLIGEYQYSLFSKLTDKAQEHLHFIFTHKGQAWIINLGLLKTWLDELNDKNGNVTSQRINVTKRILLVLRTMIDDTETNVNQGTENERTAGEDKNHSGMDRVETQAKGRARVDEDGGRPSGAFDDETIDSTPTSLADLYMDSQASSSRPISGDGTQDGGGDADNHPERTSGDDGGLDTDDSLSWTSSVDDALLESQESKGVDVTKKVVFANPSSGIERALEQRAKMGNLTVAEQAYFRKLGGAYKGIKVTDTETLEQFVKIPETKLRKIDSKVAPSLVTLSDPSMTESTATQLKKRYTEQFLDKDVAGMVLGIQNAGVALTDFKKENITNIATSYDVYTLSFHPVDGSPSTRQFTLPKVKEDGTYIIDGVKQQLQLQRMEIPIRKINGHQVALTSYYDRRLMVNRSQLVTNDYGRWLKKQITLLNESGKIETTLGNSFLPEVQVSRLYGVLSKQYKTIKTKDYTFTFDLYAFGSTEEQIKSLIADGNIPIGKVGNDLLLLDENGNVTLKGDFLGTFESLLNINTAKAPVEICTMNIGGYNFPIGVVLCFYFGIDNLLKVINADYRTVPAGDRLRLTEDEYAVTFSDESLIFNRRDMYTSLIMGGFAKLDNLVNFSRYDLNGSNAWVPIINNARVKMRQFEEMRLIFDMFIDPVTKGELIKRGYPTEMHYLLLEAVKMLTNDNTKHEVEITEQRFVGYERFAGKVYAELVRSVRQYRNKGSDRRHTVDLNPQAIMMNIITDPSVNQVEEVNPVHEIKEQEAYTFGGTGGRSEDTMVRRTRGQQENNRGIISEAGKDSGKAGFLGYLTSNAKIADYRGNINVDAKDTDTGLMSVTGNLSYGSTKDDPKRTLYSTVQQSQGVSSVNYKPSIIRTGYETVIAHRTSELYSKIAKQDGKVVKVDNTGIVVEYEDGTQDSYVLGLVIGKAAGELHRHTHVTDLKVGDTFKANDVLGWDDAYLERDVFNPGQVCLKTGVPGRLALVETQFTFEDSLEVTAEFAQATKTPYLKETKQLVKFKDGVELHVKIGDEIDYDGILCTIIPEHLVGIDNDSEFLGLQESFGLRQTRSNHHGKVVDINVLYNGDTGLMSESLKQFVESYNKRLKKINGITNSGVVDANVGGNTNVAKTAVMPNEVLITFVIEDLNETEGADKFVAGNQMKGTVGNIIDSSITTLDGRKVDVRFSFKGLFNRMVLSLRDKMAWGEIAVGITNKAIKAYRGK